MTPAMLPMPAIAQRAARDGRSRAIADGRAARRAQAGMQDRSSSCAGGCRDGLRNSSRPLRVRRRPRCRGPVRRPPGRRDRRPTAARRARRRRRPSSPGFGTTSAPTIVGWPWRAARAAASRCQHRGAAARAASRSAAGVRQPLHRAEPVARRAGGREPVAQAAARRRPCPGPCRAPGSRAAPVAGMRREQHLAAAARACSRFVRQLGHDDAPARPTSVSSKPSCVGQLDAARRAARNLGSGRRPATDAAMRHHFHLVITSRACPGPAST